ncbi:MerR family transcriptional regulator [Streptomyces sp. SID4985]|uniref:MerR family transcriptional regulator n=1 Tax=Streptomyces sp. SID4985 TaxID=2690292 RepID=UPI00136D10BE|nr:MerR family transcriptional regulator [Streptomyces sp. SID4985]MYQ45458.1 MerR family transcriptional regulator [Streptomyces sp. SID4985]
MELLTIGAFARASRLSPKALRLYDELELLRPARVAPDTGYRYYAVSQLERARLVAWLRRLGMPLAEIRAVSALEGADAAREVRAYWARVEAETAARRDLAAFLVDQLTAESGRDHTDMLELRYAARADRGHVRTVNQDTVYAGRRLLAVADGFGPAGAPASGAAVDALRFLDETEELRAGSVLNLLEDAVRGASEAIRDLGDGGDGADDSGATLTALLWTGSRLALVHIGDSRAYLLRDGELFRVTHDHSVVQSLLDEGRLTPEEAAVHPQRALLIKALGGATAPVPDLRLQEARAGDRYLLCSDGLTGVVPDGRIAELLAAAAQPADAVEALIDAANAAGGPDNIGCVVADATAVPGAGRAA